MGLPFRHNTLGGLRVVDAGRAASSTKPVDLSRVDALPKSKRWIFLQQGLSFNKHSLEQIRPINTVENCSKLICQCKRDGPIHTVEKCSKLSPSLLKDLVATKFNHWEQVKHFQWSLQHRMMQSSIDDIMFADVCKLTVGAGAGAHSMNKRWMIFSGIVVLNSRKSWPIMTL
jgi:hypothetical protein